MGLKNPLRRNKKKGGYSGGISTSSPRARFGNWGGATAPPAIRYGHSDDSNNSTIATNQPSLSKYEQKISSSAYNGSRQNDQFAQPLGLSSPPQPQQVEVGNNNEGSSWAVWGQQQSNHRGVEADTFQHQPQSTTNNNRQQQVSTRNSPFTDLAASRHTSNDMSRPPRSPGRNGSSGGGYHTEQLDPPEEVFNKHRRTKSHGSQALHQQQHRRTGSHYSSSGLSDYGSSTGQSSPGAGVGSGGLKAAMQREISRHRTDQGQGQGQHVRNNSRGSSQGQGSNHSRSNSRGSQGGRVGPSMPILDQGSRNGGRSTERQQGHTRSRSVGRNTGKKVGALAAVGGASLGSRHFNSLRVGRNRVGKSQDESTLETTSDEQQQQHLHPNSRFASAEESEIHDSGYFCDAPLVPNTNTERDESTMFGAEESTAFNESTITGETTTVEDTVGGEESTEVSYGKSKYDTKKKAVVAKQQDEEETDFSTDVDEESYMTRDEEDESYIEEEEEVSYDGTYDSSYIDDASYVSEDDRHRRRGSGRRGGSRRSRGRRRLDPSTSPGANDNTWASWFGFGGDEEETAYTPDDSAAPDSERSDSVVDPSVDTKANDERRNSIVSGETTVVEEEKSPSNNKEKKTNNKVAAVASTAAVVTGAAAVAAVVSHTHDREGRPLPESKPVRRVPSFKKSWMKSVLPTSGGGAGSSYRGAWNENKTVTSEDVTASTVSTKGSKTKTTATPKSGIANLGNRLFDVDKRQRDIYCEKHGGVENLIVRQYDEAPMPEVSNHVLVMVEVSSKGFNL